MNDSLAAVVGWLMGTINQGMNLGGGMGFDEHEVERGECV